MFNHKILTIKSILYVTLSIRSLLIFPVFFIVNTSWLSYSHANSFLCQPWKNSDAREKIGESFISEIKDGTIVFLGDKKPVSLALLIYSHPSNDIFMAASGELVTAGPRENGIRIQVFFPNKDTFFFIFTSCKRI